MNHLIISRQFPPAPNTGGGIATYVGQIAELLAARGETVHVIGQRWPGAPKRLETRLDGRLIVHRVDPDEAVVAATASASDDAALLNFLDADVPCSGFVRQATALAESLIETERIDLVEAQEYEAPTYGLMLRRAAGVGPRRRVPIVIHLHTPTEFVYNLNEWREDLRDQAITIQLERTVIRAADALLCPSRFLARIAESHYQLAPHTVTVIPYPMGNTPVQRRDDHTWQDGTICYAGRLEPRKGVTEWIDAAVAVTRQVPARFTLIGADTAAPDSGVSSMRALLRARIPPSVSGCFSFVGEVPRHQIPTLLASARIGVVPSRWENFPYACIEAMASGLPILVSPNGGMVEMIEDGSTGWIAAGSDASSLEAALRRAVATPPPVLAQMGAAAAAAIRRMCDPDHIVQRQLAFRTGVVEAGCGCLPDVAAMLPEVPREITTARVGKAGGAAAQGRTMTALDILRASPRQQLAIARRALADPRYVARWLVWHGRRAVRNVSQRWREGNHHGAVARPGKSR